MSLIPEVPPNFSVCGVNLVPRLVLQIKLS